MVDKVRFAFTEVDPNLGALSTLPYLPLILTYSVSLTHEVHSTVLSHFSQEKREN